MLFDHASDPDPADLGAWRCELCGEPEDCVCPDPDDMSESVAFLIWLEFQLSVRRRHGQ